MAIGCWKQAWGSVSGPQICQTSDFCCLGSCSRNCARDQKSGPLRGVFANMNSLRHVASVMVSLAVGTFLGLGATAAAQPHMPTGPVTAGVRIGGQLVPAGQGGQKLLAERERVLRERKLVFHHDGKQFEATFAEVGVTIQTKLLLNQARAVAHQGSLLKRLREARLARRGAVDIPLRYRLDREVARGYIARFKKAMAKKPVNARIDLAAHKKVPDQPGQALDIEASLDQLQASYLSGRVSLAAKLVDAKVTLKDLAAIDVSKVLSQFETRYSIYKRGRSTNVELATKRLNGMVLRPGTSFSFNARVGPRTVDAGFKPAPEIVGDELSIGIGGGTCQVSSTLHAAALYGGLDIVSRKSHSRPSSYTKLGLDATVAYGAVDLRIRNPFPFPVVVHALIPKRGKVRVELLGGVAVKRVKYTYSVGHIEKYLRRVTPKKWLKPGRVIRKQKGTRGMDVHSFVTIEYNDGRVEKKQYYSGYRASPEVYWVAPGYSAAELPPLPDSARGIEGGWEDLYDG